MNFTFRAILLGSIAYRLPPFNLRRLASSGFLAGYNGNTTVSTSTGSAIASGIPLVNNSGQAITVADATFMGRLLTPSGWSAVGNDVPLTANIEYPSGTVVGTLTKNASTTITVTNNGVITTDTVTLSTSIPANASYVLRVTQNPSNGLKYLPFSNGMGPVVGVSSTGSGVLMVKEALLHLGDSIVTNNSSALIAAATGRCPVAQVSIGGMTAQTFGQSGGAEYAKSLALGVAIGATRVITNWGTNDLGSLGLTATVTLGYHTTMRDLTRAAGLLYTPATLLPRVLLTSASVTSSLATSTGNVATFVVPNASKFEVGTLYTIAGATPAAYNGDRFCLSVNTSTNEITFRLASSGNTSPATGTITVSQYKPTTGIGLQAPFTAAFNPGASSERGLFNAAIRNAANFDGYVELGDYFEPTRDAGRWKVAGEDTKLPPAYTNVAVTTIYTTSRFNTNGTFAASNTLAQGVGQWTGGPNVGLSQGINGSGTTDVTFNSAPTNTATVGDTMTLLGSVSWGSDDGTHPRVSINGFGGQAILIGAFTAWLNGKL